MKASAKGYFFVALALSLSASFAQSCAAHTLTRAEVRAQLVALEQAGYSPVTSTSQTYPQDLKAAERRVKQKVDGQVTDPLAPGADGNVMLQASVAQ